MVVWDKEDPKAFGLPTRPFLWTLDQVSVLVDLSREKLIKGGYVHLEGRSIGIPTRGQIVARNIANPKDKPEWRIAEYELIRWLRVKGYHYYDRGQIRN